MKLAAVIAELARLARGDATSAEAGRALFGDDTSVMARRLALYDNAREHAAKQLAMVFSDTAKQLGERWSDISYQWYRRAPWGRFDYLPTSQGFAEFLGQVDGEPVEEWVGALAELELRSFVATAGEPAGSGAPEPCLPNDRPRLASGVAVVRVRYDFAGWIAGGRKGSPIRRRCGVLVWYAPDGERRISRLDDHEVAIFEAVRDGNFEEAEIPASSAAIEYALARWHKLGVIVGAVTGDAQPTTTVGRDLTAKWRHAPFLHVSWLDGALTIHSPVTSHALACDDINLVHIASLFANGRPLGDVIDDNREWVTPNQLVEVADALRDSGLLITRDHPATTHGWSAADAWSYRVEDDAPVISLANPSATEPLVVADDPMAKLLIRSQRELGEFGSLRIAGFRGDGVYLCDGGRVIRVAAVELATVGVAIFAPAREAFAAELRVPRLLVIAGRLAERMVRLAGEVGVDASVSERAIIQFDRWSHPVLATITLR